VSYEAIYVNWCNWKRERNLITDDNGLCSNQPVTETAINSLWVVMNLSMNFGNSVEKVL
jgi:hypothetical protein